jgi:hypothetical protein
VFRHGIVQQLAATLAAWALLFHVLAMTLMPPPALAQGLAAPAAFSLLCSGASHEGADLPASPRKSGTAGTCALCGLGHGVLDVPPVYLVPAPCNVVETLARLPRDLPRPVPNRPGSAQPRGPPAFA